MNFDHNEIQNLKKEFFSEADNRYVKIENCTESKNALSNELTSNDKRIEIIFHDVAVIKKLMWAFASGAIGSLVVAFLELILK